ncbi:MAG: hypothetical protein R2794_06820 [Chitinophagales bacterium]
MTQKNNELLTRVWQTWRFSTPQTHLWLIKFWFSASTFVAKITTFANPETVSSHPMKTMHTTYERHKLKYFIFIILVSFFASCDNKTTTIPESLATDRSQTDSLATDSVLTFSFVTNFSHKNISNTSDRQIDLLYNGIDNYLGGHSNHKVHFQTECLACEPIQQYMGGLLFAKRLLIATDQINYYKKDFDIPDSINRIKFSSDGRERTNPKFQFSDGKGSIKYIGISCNDADFNKVRLTYPTGEIVIDSLINASFFEYDLNMDGQKEQYLLGLRSCSQEFVILRIRKASDTK